MINLTKQYPYSIIPEPILTRWQKKYGEYLMVIHETNEWIIFVENGRLDCFHPSGDRLARHHIPTKQTLYLWNNNTKEPLTETEYLLKIEQEETQWKIF